ncbi:hypothetical protein [Maridesulfovibrio sp.]|uniref:hypothetical protein n=1 Tax=Maridesulfovibrio sp. TaxID=2795000 RepID=UPI0029F516A9|nr:hypothetical protein [Maridesulfovibrio sp.]
MADSSYQDDLKEQLIFLYCEIIIPDKVRPIVLKRLEGEMDKKVFAKAISGLKEKVTEIILAMEHVSVDAHRIVIPHEQYLGAMLYGEYLYHASLSGWKGVLRYVQGNNEDDALVLGKFMNKYGFEKACDFDAYECRLRKYYKAAGADEQTVHDKLVLMRHCLEAYFKE